LHSEYSNMFKKYVTKMRARKKIIVKIVCLFMTVAVLLSSTGIGPAYAGGMCGSHIAPQSIFSPELDPRQVKDIAMLEYVLASGVRSRIVDVMKEDEDRSASELGVDFSGSKEAGTEIQFLFSRSDTGHGSDNLRILPCTFKAPGGEETIYWCSVLEDTSSMVEAGLDRYKFTFFTEEEYKRSRERMIEIKYAERERKYAEAILKAASSEKDQDEKIRNAILADKYVRINDDNCDLSLSFIYTFLDIVSPQLSMDFVGLVEDGQLMIITGKDKENKLSEPHGGQQGIYLPDSPDYINIGTIVHEVFAKAGFTHEENRIFQEIFEDFVEKFTDDRLDTPGALPAGMELTPGKKRLLEEAKTAGFIDLGRFVTTRDYSEEQDEGKPLIYVRQSGDGVTPEDVEAYIKGLGEHLGQLKAVKEEEVKGVIELFRVSHRRREAARLTELVQASRVRLVEKRGVFENKDVFGVCYPDPADPTGIPWIFIRGDIFALEDSFPKKDHEEFLPAIVSCIGASLGYSERESQDLAKNIVTPGKKVKLQLTEEDKKQVDSLVDQLLVFRKDIISYAEGGDWLGIVSKVHEMAHGIRQIGGNVRMDSAFGILIHTITTGAVRVPSEELTQDGQADGYNLAEIDLMNGVFSGLSWPAQNAMEKTEMDAAIKEKARERLRTAFSEESDIKHRFDEALGVLEIIKEMGAVMIVTGGDYYNRRSCVSVADIQRMLLEVATIREEKFRELFNTVPVGIHVMKRNDLGKWVIADVNEFWLQWLFNGVKEDVIGSSIFDYIDPFEREAAEKHFEEKLEKAREEWKANGQAGRKETRSEKWTPEGRPRTYIKLDGRKVICSARDKIIFNERGEPVEVRTTLQDVTALTGALQALRESENRVHAILENYPDGLYVKEFDPDNVNLVIKRVMKGRSPEELTDDDFQDALEELTIDELRKIAPRITHTNHMMYEVLGLPLPDSEDPEAVNIVGMTDFDILDHEMDNKVGLQEKYRAGKYVIDDLKVYLGKESIYGEEIMPLEERAMFLQVRKRRIGGRVLCLFANVTRLNLALEELKERAKMLEQERQKFRILTEETSDIAVLLDQKNQYVYISPAVKDLGYSEQEVTGRALGELVHEDDMEVVENAIAHTRENPWEKVKLPPFRVWHKSRERLFWLEGEVCYIPDFQDGVVRFHGRDITDRVRAENAFGQNEQKIHDMFEGAQIGLATFDEDGSLAEANERCRDISGISSVEEGPDIFSIVDPVAADKLMRGEPVTLDTDLSGTKVKCHVTPHGPGRDAGPSGYVMQFQTLEELEEQQAELEQIMARREQFASLENGEKTVMIQVGSPGKTALVYGQNVDEAIKVLRIRGFNGEIVVAPDRDALERLLRSDQHFDIIVNTTSEDLAKILEEIFSDPSTRPQVLDKDVLTDTHKLQDTLLELCA